jgi:hypothetical protein
LEGIVAGVVSIAYPFSTPNSAPPTGVVASALSSALEPRIGVGVDASAAVLDATEFISTACCHRTEVTGRPTCATVVYSTALPPELPP